jgi:hypothetical protein
LREGKKPKEVPETGGIVTGGILKQLMRGVAGV